MRAESNGRLPASAAAKELKVPIEFIRAQGSAEWHHTSKEYNKTEYYDVNEIAEHLLTEEGQAQLQKIQAELRAKKEAQAIVYSPVIVTWLEWSGTCNRPKCTERSETGCTVTDRGGKFLEIELPSGEKFKKGRNTNGFSFKRII